MYNNRAMTCRKYENKVGRGGNNLNGNFARFTYLLIMFDCVWVSVAVVM